MRREPKHYSSAHAFLTNWTQKRMVSNYADLLGAIFCHAILFFYIIMYF